MRPALSPREAAAVEAAAVDLTRAGRTLGPTPGVRESWHRGRRDYAVWVVRVEDPRVWARSARVAAALAPLGAAAAPGAVGPHVTTWVAGFPTSAEPSRDDDVTWDTLDAQARAVATRPPFDLQLGGAGSFRSCAFLAVGDPAGGLAGCRAALGRGHRELRYAPYLPHLTVGTYLGGHDADAVLGALAPLRDLPPLSLRVDSLELVTFDATTPGAPLETVRRVALSG